MLQQVEVFGLVGAQHTTSQLPPDSSALSPLLFCDMAYPAVLRPGDPDVQAPLNEKPADEIDDDSIIPHQSLSVIVSVVDQPPILRQANNETKHHAAEGKEQPALPCPPHHNRKVNPS